MLTVMLLAAMEKALLMMLIFFGIISIIGMYDAWLKKRGVVGWIVSVLAAIVGGIVAMSLSVAIGDAVITRWPSSSVGELLASSAPILMLVGAWAAIRVVNRFR